MALATLLVVMLSFSGVEAMQLKLAEQGPEPVDPCASAFSKSQLDSCVERVGRHANTEVAASPEQKHEGLRQNWARNIVECSAVSKQCAEQKSFLLMERVKSKVLKKISLLGKSNQPEIIEVPEADDECSALAKALTDNEADNLDSCVAKSKHFDGAVKSFQNVDEAGAKKHLNEAYVTCLKGMGKTIPAGNCLMGWAEQTFTYDIKDAGLGVTETCKKEAHTKYNASPQEVEKCSKEYQFKLENAEDDDKLRQTYSTILQKCAGVSKQCADQNSFTMMENLKQKVLKKMGLDQDSLRKQAEAQSLPKGVEAPSQPVEFLLLGSK